MTECQHTWKKWEKEQGWYRGKDEHIYYQRRECKHCGMAEWRVVKLVGDEVKP